jgi:radical SAM superfamily enzyme YgiQ (UPF0313 family)
VNLLFLQPLRIYKRWPMPEDFTGLISSVPTLAMAQLEGCLPGHRHVMVDGIAREYTLTELDRHAAQADVVLINAHSSIGALNAEANLKRIKERAPSLPVIMGGHHATLYDAEWIARGADYVVRHEGENTIRELIPALEARADVAGIAGLSWRGPDGTVRRNPDRPLEANLDDLPIPDWSLLEPRLYGLPLPGKGWATSVETSRGCSHRCTFCAASNMWFNQQRYKSAERVLEELRILHRLGYRKLWVVDDNFVDNVERDVQIYEGILREKLDLKWMCFIRSDSVSRHPDAIALAARAGMCFALVGFESNLVKMLKAFGKGTLGADYQRTSAILRRHQVFIGGFFIVGYLDETREETAQIFEGAERLADYPIVSIFEPRRGTVAYTRSETCGDLPTPDMFYHNTTHALPSLREGLMQQYRDFYRRYLVAPEQLRKMAFGTPTQRSFYRFLFAGMARSMASVSIDKLRNPWEMVLDIRQ